METKNHTVVFYLSWRFNDLDFKCKNLTESFESNNVESHKLREDAYHKIKNVYKAFFNYDNFTIHIIGID